MPISKTLGVDSIFDLSAWAKGTNFQRERHPVDSAPNAEALRTQARSEF